MNISSVTKQSPLIRKVEKVSKTPETRNHLFKDHLEISLEARNISSKHKNNISTNKQG